ncbi:hypothetical protein [Leclercia adecarboxylata]|uniref:hypothetical protein n=1 Tax=Leclercia adecarboxylata TaxID=83655 RepID=UPI001D12DB07|nr:hypothetical protein [Leclercia adecarboxylata]
MVVVTSGIARAAGVSFATRLHTHGKIAVQGAPAPAPQPVKQICPAKRTKQQAPEMVLILTHQFYVHQYGHYAGRAAPSDAGSAGEEFDREPRRISLAHRSAKQVIDEVPKTWILAWYRLQPVSKSM